MSQIRVPVSFGELLDKIAILEIKEQRIGDAAKRAHVAAELEALRQTWSAHPAASVDVAALRAALAAVNQRLWEIEDAIRLQEKAQRFDAEFIRLARAVYFENDQRARIKREINAALGSTYIEEKSYPHYHGGDAA